MKGSTGRSGPAQALLSCRSAFASVALFSALVNLLMLTGAIFMLEVYDRVLPSRSVPTLVGLAAIALGLFLFMGVLDGIRSRVLTRIGGRLDEELHDRVYGLAVRLPLRAPGADALQPLRDLDTIRAFLGSPGPLALFDLPWLPFYLLICFAFHPLVGWTATAGALVLVVLTFFTERLSLGPARAAHESGAARFALADASRRNAEVLQAMAMAPRLGARWSTANDAHVAAQSRVSDVVGGFGVASKTLRMALQSAVLGVGAFLAIGGLLTPGLIIAGSIVAARALAPVELAIAHWRQFVAARQAWTRLHEVLPLVADDAVRTELPAPSRTLSVEGVSVAPPGGQRITLSDTAFTLRAGQGLGIIGPSASGKSTLARALVGVWPPLRGRVRLDGAALEHWPPEMLGRHVGYMPQDVALFDGTVAENIARFQAGADPASVVAAARAAGVHDLILRLPDGYETVVGEHGTALSAGQRQRIALARALYGEPFLVVLDEPNSNLDLSGEEALTQAIRGVRERGGIVVVVAHRPAAINGVDQVMILAEGQVKAIGPKEEIMSNTVRRPPKDPPLKVVERTSPGTPQPARAGA